MSNLMEYKCPCCGGHLEFDATSQNIKCPYCETEFDISQFTDETKAEELQDTKESEQDEKTNEWHADELKGMYVYACKSCNGEIIGDETLGATRCPYCGNTVVMKEQFSGDLRPDLIIPFSKTKEEAIQNLESHVKQSIFAPAEYKSRDSLEEIRGVYVPFWLYDTDADFDMNFTTRVMGRKWREGDFICQEYKDFHIQKAGMVDFHDVPVDASTKMADELMDSLEPFDLSAAVAFNPVYMAGYAADRYDVDQKQNEGRLDERVRDFVNHDVRNELREYAAVQYVGGHVNIGAKKAKYVLLPVWVLSSTWNGEIYTYAMNGQTGKVSGKIPVDSASVRKYWRKYSVIFSIIAYIISLLIFLI